MPYSANPHATPATGPRGAYEEQFPRTGLREFYAVTSTGRTIVRVEVETTPDEPLDWILELMQQRLNRLDPVSDPAPGLRLLP